MNYNSTAMTVNTSPTNSRVKELPVNKEVITTSQEKTVDEMFIEFAKQNVALRNFCREYLETIEGFWVTNPYSLSPEHKQEYIECAQFMQDNFGRVNNMIKEIKATL